MPATYEPIASTTLGSNATSITLSNIPGTFTDLFVVLEGQTDAGGIIGVYIDFNSDTANNYSVTQLNADGTSAWSSRNSNLASIHGAVLTSTVRANAFWHIMSYANTNVFKTVLCGGNAADAYVRRSVGLWRSTSAITSLRVWHESRSFITGTTLSLYGIKAA